MQLTLCASRLSADSPDWAGKHEDANSPMGKVGLLEISSSAHRITTVLYPTLSSSYSDPWP